MALRSVLQHQYTNNVRLAMVAEPRKRPVHAATEMPSKDGLRTRNEDRDDSPVLARLRSEMVSTGCPECLSWARPPVGLSVSRSSLGRGRASVQWRMMMWIRRHVYHRLLLPAPCFLHCHPHHLRKYAS